MENIQHPTSKACIRFPVCLGIGTTNLRRMRLHHQGAAGILPAELFSDASADKMPAAPSGSRKGANGRPLDVRRSKLDVRCSFISSQFHRRQVFDLRGLAFAKE